MNQDMMEALQLLAAERGISVDALFGALADALGVELLPLDGGGAHGVERDGVRVQITAEVHAESGCAAEQVALLAAE